MAEGSAFRTTTDTYPPKNPADWAVLQAVSMFNGNEENPVALSEQAPSSPHQGAWATGGRIGSEASALGKAQGDAHRATTGQKVELAPRAMSNAVEATGTPVWMCRLERRIYQACHDFRRGGCR